MNFCFFHLKIKYERKLNFFLSSNIITFIWLTYIYIYKNSLNCLWKKKWNKILIIHLNIHMYSPIFSYVESFKMKSKLGMIFIILRNTFNGSFKNIVTETWCDISYFLFSHDTRLLPSTIRDFRRWIYLSTLTYRNNLGQKYSKMS